MHWISYLKWKHGIAAKYREINQTRIIAKLYLPLSTV